MIWSSPSIDKSFSIQEHSKLCEMFAPCVFWNLGQILHVCHATRLNVVKKNNSIVISMLPLVLQWNIPNIFQLFSLVIWWRKILKRKRANQHFLEIMHIFNGFLNMILLWLQLLDLMHTLLNIHRRKKRLLKPHLLLKMLGGFRWNIVIFIEHWKKQFMIVMTFWKFFLCFHRNEYIPTDMWIQLERNWLYFFWLTGEIPSTLQIVVNRIKKIFLPNITRSRNQCLSFRNQVSFLKGHSHMCSEGVTWIWLFMCRY